MLGLQVSTQEKREYSTIHEKHLYQHSHPMN
jgi:hypothetical protein